MNQAPFETKEQAQSKLDAFLNGKGTHHRSYVVVLEVPKNAIPQNIPFFNI